MNLGVGFEVIDAADPSAYEKIGQQSSNGKGQWLPHIKLKYSIAHAFVASDANPSRLGLASRLGCLCIKPSFAKVEPSTVKQVWQVPSAEACTNFFAKAALQKSVHASMRIRTPIV